MHRRPASISILVGFFSIVCAVYVLLTLRTVFVIGDSSPGDASTPPPAIAPVDSMLDTTESPLIPTSAMPFISLTYWVVAFVCSVNILEGANWARWLFTGASALLLICHLVVYSNHLLPQVPLTLCRLVVVSFLFLPSANEYFRNPN